MVQHSDHRGSAKSGADPARLFFKDPSYDGQFVRSVSATYAGAADLGEVFATARGLGPLSGRTWHTAWSRAADSARESGQAALLADDRVGAREAFLRASEYYRQAYYFIRAGLDDPRLQGTYRMHVNAFIAATELMSAPVSRVRIPYDDTTLSAYLFTPKPSPELRPTILIPCGYDSTAEAGWVNVPPALARGYNVLLFEGPGQGEMLYTQRRYLRPDFEHVASQVIDWLIGRAEVDAARLVLIGRSFGGYLAPRAASADRRLAALVCDPAQPDMGARLPGGLVGHLAVPLVRAQMRLGDGRAEFFGARMAAHGVRSIGSYFAELRRFTMLDRAAQITCPTLIVEAEHDFAGGGGQALFDALICPKRLVRLTAAQGADGHCAGLGQQIWNGVVYRWLESILGPTAATD